MKQKWGGNLSYDLICSPADWSHVCHSLLSCTSTKYPKKRCSACLQLREDCGGLLPESLKKKADWRHLSGGGYGASRLLWPHDPSIIDDVTFFHEQIQKPFASMHATAPGLAVLFAVNFIHMSKKCTIKGVTVKGTAHRRLTVRVREPDCFQCKHPASAASNALRTAVYLDAGRHVDYSIFPSTDTLWSGVFLPHSLSKWTLHSYCTLTASSVRTLRPVGHQMIQRYLLWLVSVRGEKITFWDVWHQRQRQYKANN